MDTTHLRRVSIFSFGENDWKLAAESCIRYGSLGHKLLSRFGASKGLLLWFSLTETPKCSQGFLSWLPGAKGLL